MVCVTNKMLNYHQIVLLTRVQSCPDLTLCEEKDKVYALTTRSTYNCLEKGALNYVYGD